MDAQTPVITQIAEARHRTLVWLHAMLVDDASGVSRVSAAHDPAAWPGMMLPGTYNAVMCRVLLDDPMAIDAASLIGWFHRFRRPDGVFRIEGMHDDAVFKRPEPGETWRYIDWHVTNYALGAIAAVAPGEVPVLEFARPFTHVPTLKAWLADRDMRDPWLEGNNIVNLGGFLIGLEAHDALAALLHWHDYHQEPATGFWGTGQLSDERRLLHAFAGSMHNYHLYYALGRDIAFHDKAVDYALSRPTTIDSACIDVDLVDLLVHALHRVPHRRVEIMSWLRFKLAALLAFQNRDGGFADERAGIRRQDGWVRGYEEPQGLSNTFATWFRWIAIAMIADLCWPGEWHFRFRADVGIGYRA